MAKKKEKLMILDGHALIHRSFHALPPTMRTKDGRPTNAVYGFAGFLIKAIRELKPEYVALAMDEKGPTFRHEKFLAYKATRAKAPDELYEQIPLVEELAKSFNIPIFKVAGFEADDLIGTITRKVNGDIEKIIVTGDMDTLQLVDGATRVYAMSRGVSESMLYDRSAVKERYGLEPGQLIDYKALRGDPSDNIPGVPGIGEKTASELLREFRTLDNLYSHLDSKKIKDRIRGLLQDNKKQAYLSQELARIDRDVKIKFDLEATRFKDLDKEAVIDKFSDFEFKSLLPRAQALFNEQVTATKEERTEAANGKFERNQAKFDYRLVSTGKDFDAFFKELRKQKNFTFDTETSSFDPLRADLLGISFSWQKGRAYYLNVSSKESAAEKSDTNLFNYKSNRKSKIENRKSLHPWLVKLKPIFEDAKIGKCAHNAKFDVRVMGSNGVEVNGLQFDTMIASYLLNPGSRQHNLDGLAFSELGFEKISKDDLLGKGRERLGFSEVDTGKLSLYSCEDADFTERLRIKLKPELARHDLKKLFNDIEMPLVKVLAKMEDNGIKLNSGLLSRMETGITEKLQSLEKTIHQQAGGEFNVRSTQQLKEVLFERLVIPALDIKKTKTGYSTAAEELDKLRDQHPIIRLIQEHRELAKLLSTYIKALPELVNERTGRIHTSFNQTVTATGRLSSTEPNLQNIPVKTELGREIRKAFVTDRGYRLLALDYSQIELRLAAHMSGDKKMIEAFRHQADIHTSTAAEINRVSPASVTPAMRREAKAVNFGILYGQGPHGLSRTADIPYVRAKDFIEQYFLVFEDIKKYIDQAVSDARAKGYAETLFGRRRLLPEIDASVAPVRKAAERMAVNTPLQGTAADMIKVAMIEVDKLLAGKYRNDEARMLLQVHDELVLEAKSALAAELAQEVKAIMENVIKLKIPIVVDVRAGKNWGEMAALA